MRRANAIGDDGADRREKRPATNRILVLAAYSSFAAFPMAPQFLLVRVIDADCETLPPAAVTVIE